MLALVVDDDYAIRSYVQSILLGEGFETLDAEDGDEALHIVNALGGDVDLIITDIQMPGRDGVSVANEVSRAFPSVPVILMSGFEAPEGDYVFIQKPFSWVSMRALIRRVAPEARQVPPAA